MPVPVIVCPARNPRAARIVAGLLAQESDLQVTLCHACAPRHVGSDGPNEVVILTAGLPDMRDVSQLESALRLHPWTPVIVLSMYEDPVVTRHLLAHGAAAFLALDQVVSRLPRLIRQLSGPSRSQLALHRVRAHAAP